MDQWRARVASLTATLRCTRAEAVGLAVLLAGTVAGLGVVWWLARPAPDAQAGSSGTAVAEQPAGGGAAGAGSGSAAKTAGSGGAAGTGTGTGGGSGQGSGLAAQRQAMVVHVTGEVVEPGVVEVPAGSRVRDAIEAAGGAAPKADLSRVNLAREVTDGEQIVVAHVDDPAQGSDSATGPDGRIDVNQADAETLQQVPGIGPVTAQRLITFREDHGPITAEQQLLDVPGIGPKTLDQLVNHLRW